MQSLWSYFLLHLQWRILPYTVESNMCSGKTWTWPSKDKVTATLQYWRCFWKACFLWKVAFCVHSWLWKLAFYKCPVLLIRMDSLKRDWWGWSRCLEAGAAAARFWSGNLQLHFTQELEKSLNTQDCQVVRRKWSMFLTSSFCGTDTAPSLCESNNHLLLTFL